MSYNNEELIYLYHLGSQIAYDLLIKLYITRINFYLQHNYLNITPLAYEDYIQLALMSFTQAIDHYRFDFTTKMDTFFSKVLDNTFKRLIKQFSSAKQIPPHKIISLNSQSQFGDEYESFLFPSNNYYRPDYCLTLKEDNAKYNQLAFIASNQEKEVLKYIFQGYDFPEIAEILHIDLKSVYNANYRLQKKLRKANIKENH